MIIRLLLSLTLLFSLYMGWGEYQLWQAVRVPLEQYQALDGEVVYVVHELDGGPGNVVSGNFKNQYIRIRYRYTTEGSEQQSDAITPLCSRCEAYQLKRLLGYNPMELREGSAVRVWLDSKDNSRVFLSMASSDEQQNQAWKALLWLAILPAFLFLLWKLAGSKSIDTGR